MARTGSKPIDELIRLAIIGDGTAFTALWDKYIDSLRAFIRCKIKNVDSVLVDEICCYSFEKAFRHISDFDPSKSQFFTWLTNIAWNTALDILKRERKAHPAAQLMSLDGDPTAAGGAEGIPDDVDTPLDTIIRDESTANTEKHINALPDLYRDIAHLRLIDGLPYKEIADRLGLELNTVRTRIKRAKEQIERMRDEEEN